MGCHRCGNLDPKKKSAGKAGGNLYFCKKMKTFVNPSKFSCDKFKKADRKEWQNNEIYDDGKRYYNDRTPAIVYFILFAILVIIGLLSGVFSFN